MNQELDLIPNHVPSLMELYVGPVEAADLLGWSVQTVLFCAMIRLIPAHRLHHEGQTAWRFKVSELTEWSMQNRSAAGPKGSKQLASTEVGESLAPASDRLDRLASDENQEIF